MSTLRTAMSSSTHPVTGNAPTTFTMPSLGVSKTPTGLPVAPAEYTRVVTVIGTVTPDIETLTVPVYDPTDKLFAAMLIETEPVPVPLVGDTRSQLRVVDALQDLGPPVATWLTSTDCAGVCCVMLLPDRTAPNDSAV